jgi:hypothetical protein
VQRPEAAPAPLRLGEAHHDEVVGPLGPELEPEPRAATAVGGVRALRHQALELESADLGVEVLAPLGDVVEEADGTGMGQQALQEALALEEGKRPRVEPLEAEEVERVVGGGKLERGVADVGRLALLGATLQALEARA